MSSILISGSMAYDRIMNFPGTFREHFHADKMHTLSVSFVVSTLEQTYGGTAGNIAYTLSLLGQKPSILAAVGGDFGDYWARLEKMGVDTASLQRETNIPTAVGHIITDKEDNQITAFYPGAMARAYLQEIPKAELGMVAAGNVSDMVDVPKKFRSAGTPFFYDPGQMLTVLTGAALREAIPGAVVLFGNDYEIGMLEKKTGWGPKELLEHVSAVVTTLGGEGTRLLTKEKEITVKPVPALQVLDPTGAGDAYRGGFAVAWLKKLPLEQCTKVASAVAVYAVESYGTQKHTFTMEQLAKRYEDAYKDKFPL